MRAAYEAQIAALERKVGQLTMELDLMKLSAWALWYGLATPLIEPTSLWRFKARRYSALAYWLPRSVWHMHPGGGLRLRTAASRAATVSCESISREIA